jgi:hypothetical protein
MALFDYEPYPVFEPNQILTSTQLNQIGLYLDDQNRLTRTKIAGVGIVCGLEPSFASGKITISCGYGITTDGYIISLDQTVYTKYTGYTDPGDPVYDIFKSGTSQISMMEIFPDSTSVKSPHALTEIAANDLASKVVVLFLEYYDEELQSCTGSNCDIKGKQRDFNVRVLLIDKSFLSPVNYDDEIYIEEKLPLINILRFHEALKKNGLNLDEVTGYDDIKKGYGLIISDYEDHVVKSINAAYEVFHSVLCLTEKDLNVLDKLKELKKENAIQYDYDLLSDLILAYNEFACYAYEFLRDCCPTIAEFPRHLMLGLVKPDNSDYVEHYRHYFLNAPWLCCHQDKKTVVAQMLFGRMLKMIRSYENPEEQLEIKITPGKYYPVSLSRRSIPFYYFGKESKEDILKYWNPELTLKKREEDNLSYYGGIYWNTGNDIIKNPLSYNINDLPFYRIEGHIGYDLKKAFANISDLKYDHNLAFNLVALNLKDVNKLNAEKKKKDINIQYDSYYAVKSEYSINEEAMSMLSCGFDDIQLSYAGLRVQMLSVLETIEHDADGAILTAQAFYSYLETLLPQLKGFDFQPIKLTFSKLYALLTKSSFYQFSYPDFIVEYKALLALFFDLNVFINTLWELMLVQLLLNPTTAVITEYLIFEKLIDIVQGMITKLSDDNTYLGLANIYYSAMQRVKYINERGDGIFENFAAKHIGMEHLAGVQNGGTFILAYEETEVKVENQKLKEIEEAITELERQLEEISRMSDGSYEFYGNKNMKFNEMTALKKKIERLKKEEAALLKETSKTVATVVADFALPYLCCCDCCEFPPMKVNIPPVAKPDFVQVMRKPPTITTQPPATVIEPVTVTINVLRNDYDEYIATNFILSIDGADNSGVFTTDNNGTVTIIPDPNDATGNKKLIHYINNSDYYGYDTFTYRIKSNATGLSDSAEVVVFIIADPRKQIGKYDTGVNTGAGSESVMFQSKIPIKDKVTIDKYVTPLQKKSLTILNASPLYTFADTTIAKKNVDEANVVAEKFAVEKVAADQAAADAKAASDLAVQQQADREKALADARALEIKTSADHTAAEQAAADAKKVADQAAADQAAKEKAIAGAKALADKNAASAAAAEKAAADAKVAADKAAADKIASDKAIADAKTDAEKTKANQVAAAAKAAADKAEAERVARQKASADAKAAADKAAADKAALDKAAADAKALAEKTAAEQAAREKALADAKAAAENATSVKTVLNQAALDAKNLVEKLNADNATKLKLALDAKTAADNALLAKTAAEKILSDKLKIFNKPGNVNPNG